MLNAPKQFWRQLARSVRPALAASRAPVRADRRAGRRQAFEVWRAPLARPFYVRASSRAADLGGVRSPLGGIRSPFGGGNQSYTKRIQRLFQGNRQGWFLDADDEATMFEDAAGTIPMVGVEKPVGLWIDKSKGLVVGSDLSTNGNFAVGTGWAFGAGWAIASGIAQATATSSDFYQPLASVALGKYYEITFTISNYSAGTIRPFVGNVAVIGTWVSANGTYTQRLFCFNAALEWGFRTTGFTGHLDNVSIKEISGGNHAYQTTSAARPTRSARYNLLTKTESGVLADYATRSNVSQVAFAGVDSGLGLAFPSGVTSYALKNDSIPLATYKIRVLVRMDDNAGPPVFGSATPNHPANDLVLAGGNVDLSPATYTVEDLGGGLYAVSAVYTSTGTSNHGVLKYLGNSGRSFTSSGWDIRSSTEGSGLPAYQRVNTSTDYDTVGFPKYVVGDGATRWMRTASIDFSGTDEITHLIGLRKLSDAAQATIHELGDGTATQYKFNLNGLSYTNSVKYLYVQSGSLVPNPPYTESTNTAHAAPHSAVLTCAGKISTDYSILRVNGVQEGSDADNQGTGNFSNLPVYFFSRGGTSLFHNMRLYQSVVVGALLDANTIASTEALIRSKAKLY